MTSEQRNEIAMEVLDEVLTEATRYAKETHKKAKKDRREMKDSAKYGASKKAWNKYVNMSWDIDAHGPVSQKLKNKYYKQGDYAWHKQHDNIDRDTIDVGKDKNTSLDHKTQIGKQRAKRQPGRYEY